MSVIEVNHVTKAFQLGQMRSLKQTALDTVARIRGHSPLERPSFKALDDVDFKVAQGEVLGIIGHNGAGKSTLLKLLAGISKPTHGSIEVRGKVAPLIEVGAGLVPELTGRENIFLNASILGLKRVAIAAKFDEIVAFAEIEEFIDTPVKRYSSGMHVRLGFAIATSVDADILIVDEVLAVGDLAFQRKCFDRMESMIKRQQKTVLLVSHNIRQVERICSRVLLLDKGQVVDDGKPISVCKNFYERTDEKIRSNAAKAFAVGGQRRYKTSGDIDLLEISLQDENGNRVDKIVHHRDVTVSITLSANARLHGPHFGLGVHTADFLYLATHLSEEQFSQTLVEPGIIQLKCKLHQFPFLPGVYSLRFGIAVGEMHSTIFYAENLYEFQVVTAEAHRADAMRQGFVAMSADWTMSHADAMTTEQQS